MTQLVRESRVCGDMRLVLATALALTLLILPASAGAATVSVRPDPDSGYPGEGAPQLTRDEVFYLAAPGEQNRLVFTYAGDATAVTVTDPGAPVAAGDGCTAVDAHTARCTPQPGGLSTYLQSFRAELGDLDDEIRSAPGSKPVGGVRASGGPGDDRLDGGDGSDVLDGGGGRDVLLGGGQDDVLEDGDVDGAPGDAGPGPDVLDGGAGSDELSYAQRTAPVAVDAAQGGPAGEAGEGDAVTGVESLTGGAGDDELRGDDAETTLIGGAGDDDLTGAAGRDRLEGGAGVDVLDGGPGGDSLRGGTEEDDLSCGSGADVVFDTQHRELLTVRCERVVLRLDELGEDTLSLRPTPVARSRARGTVDFAFECPRYEARDGEAGPCRGTARLRKASSRVKLGRVSFGIVGSRRTVRVRLSRAGRRLARRPDGVLARVFLGGKRYPDAAWTIRLKL